MFDNASVGKSYTVLLICMTLHSTLEAIQFQNYCVPFIKGDRPSFYTLLCPFTGSQPMPTTNKKSKGASRPISCWPDVSNAGYCSLESHVRCPYSKQQLLLLSRMMYLHYYCGVYFQHYLFLADIFASYLSAAVLYLTVEAPFSNLTNYFLQGRLLLCYLLISEI